MAELYNKCSRCCQLTLTKQARQLSRDVSGEHVELLRLLLVVLVSMVAFALCKLFIVC